MHLNASAVELASEKVLTENYCVEQECSNLGCFLTTNLEILPSSYCQRNQQAPSHVDCKGIWEMWHGYQNQIMKRTLIEILGS